MTTPLIINYLQISKTSIGNGLETSCLRRSALFQYVKQLIPLSIPVNRGSGVSQRGKHSMNRLGVALVSLDLRSRHLTLGRVDEYITLLSLNRCLLTIAICLVPFLWHSLCKLNDGTHLTPYRQRNDDAISYFVNSRSQTIFKLCSYPIFYP